MPRDSNGVYSLPIIYLAVTGATILAAQHNGPMEDIEAALTESLPRSGTAPMTGPLKLADGSESFPALAFNSLAGIGFYKTATPGIGVSVGGAKVAEFTSGGLIGLPIGTPIPVLDDTLPGLCLWADGRNVSRTDYAALFARWGTKYGAGDGSTTFGIPDLRGRGLLGRDNTGGTDASRLVSVFTVSGSRLITGGILGEALHTLSVAESPSHSHGGITSTDNAHAHTYDTYGNISAYSSSTPGPSFGVNNDAVKATSTTPAHAHTIATNAVGGGGAHNNVQPSLLCNWVIYAGA